MAERREGQPPRKALLRAIGDALVTVDPPLRVVAERVLGLDRLYFGRTRRKRGVKVVDLTIHTRRNGLRFQAALFLEDGPRRSVGRRIHPKDGRPGTW